MLLVHTTGITQLYSMYVYLPKLKFLLEPRTLVFTQLDLDLQFIDVLHTQ